MELLERVWNNQKIRSFRRGNIQVGWSCALCFESLGLQCPAKLFAFLSGWWGARHTFAFMSFLGMANLYAMRVNLSVAIVAMTKSGNSIGKELEQRGSLCYSPWSKYCSLTSMSFNYHFFTNLIVQKSSTSRGLDPLFRRLVPIHPWRSTRRLKQFIFSSVNDTQIGGQCPITSSEGEVGFIHTPYMTEFYFLPLSISFERNSVRPNLIGTPTTRASFSEHSFMATSSPKFPVATFQKSSAGSGFYFSVPWPPQFLPSFLRCPRGTARVCSSRAEFLWDWER